jgi:DNA-binding MurR/RpiR family transcriptional regulator
MSRYKEIKEKIQSKFRELPKNQRKIADYIVDNFDKVSFLNVQDISLATGASVASVVRFAQRIGFSGYSELRDEIADSLQNHLSNSQTFPLFDKRKVVEDILTSVANLDVKNINETLHLIDRTTFNYVIDRISNSERVFTAGLGISYLLAEILAYQLTQVGINSSVLQHSHTLFNEHILFLKPKDLLIVFSFPPYSKETIEAAEYAKKRKINVISVTNKQASPVTFFTKENLIVKSENMLFTNSFAAISVLINAIATACAIKDKQRAKKVLKETEEIMINQNQIIRGS